VIPVEVLTALAALSVVLTAIDAVHSPIAMWSQRKASRRPPTSHLDVAISVIVPAYNEGVVVGTCVDSILALGHPRLEMVLVDDGSSDDTLEVLRTYEHLDNVTVLSQTNSGKAAALNHGIAYAHGEVMIFVDADGIFTEGTIPELLEPFRDPRVAAVCGNDQPVNLGHVQTRLLALLTHCTALVRRSLAALGVLTIVSGNCGAFRGEVVRDLGGFSEGLGEDLELTWRVHRAGHRVAFAPSAIVYAEVPSRLDALWKQRVRWARGHIQTAVLHRDMIGRARFGRIGYYLPYNLLTMLFLPVIQIATVTLLLASVGLGGAVPVGVLLPLSIIGFGAGLVTILISITLDRAWRDLRYLPTLLLWPAFSLMMSAVVVRALLLEVTRAPANWNKFARTGETDRLVTSTSVDADPSGACRHPRS
jgi:biofilm PGA synthesis N-glycosyltransferase PgaC